MSFAFVDISSAIRRVADRRIEEAMADGKFDRLSGVGKELDLEPLPPGEASQARWWALRLMKQHGVAAEEVQWRKAIDRLRGQIAATDDHQHVGSLCAEANQLIGKLNTLGTNAIDLPIAPVDVRAERLAAAARRAAK